MSYCGCGGQNESGGNKGTHSQNNYTGESISMPSLSSPLGGLSNLIYDENGNAYNNDGSVNSYDSDNQNAESGSGLWLWSLIGGLIWYFYE